MTAPQTHALCAIVVTYNRLPHLKLTLARLLDSPESALARVVVVNNASTDGTADWLATQTDPRIDVVTSAENRGGAGGFEQGMRHAMAHHNPSWLVLMDDDGRPTAGTLETFRDLDHGDWDAVAAAVYYPDGRICEMNRPSVNPFWSLRTFGKTVLRWRNGYHIPYSDYDSPGPRPIDLTSFVGFFLRADVVRAAGYPNPALFLYGDDVIYTLGLRRDGFRIAFDPRLPFDHDCATFENDAHRAFRPLWKVYYAYRNSLMMYHMATGPLFWMLVPLLWVKWYRAADRYGDDRATYLKLYRAAMGDGIRGRTTRSHADIMKIATPISAD